jgi:hypothetical protein
MYNNSFINQNPTPQITTSQKDRVGKHKEGRRDFTRKH